MPTPGEDYQAWSRTALSNGTIDPLVNWQEGQTRKSVNNSSRSELAAHAKNRDLQNGSITTSGSANAQAFFSNVGYTTVPTGLRVLLKIGPGLTNTGSATLMMDNIANYGIKSQAGTNLPAGALLAGTYCEFIFNGSNWILLSQPLGGQVMLGKATAAVSAVVDFTTGIDSTYDVYVFTFTNVRPSINAAGFIAVCGSGGGASWKAAPGDYAEGMTSINANTGVFSTAGLLTEGAVILAGSLTSSPGAQCAGELRWYAPWRSAQAPLLWEVAYNTGSAVIFNRGGCYCTHTALNSLRFGFTTGNIETGDFAVYGVVK